MKYANPEDLDSRVLKPERGGQPQVRWVGAKSEVRVGRGGAGRGEETIGYCSRFRNSRN